MRVFPEAYAVVEREGFAAEPEELQLRLVMMLCARFGGLSRPPRLVEAERLVAALAGGQARGRSLGGCRFVPGPGVITVGREAGRIGSGEFRLEPGRERLWDGRFRLRVPEDFGPVRVSPAAGRLHRQGLPFFVASALPVLEDARGQVFWPETSLEGPFGASFACAQYENQPELRFS